MGRNPDMGRQDRWEKPPCLCRKATGRSAVLTRGLAGVEPRPANRDGGPFVKPALQSPLPLLVAVFRKIFRHNRIIIRLCLKSSFDLSLVWREEQGKRGCRNRNKKTPSKGGWDGGPYWARTSDLFHVKETL